MAPRVDDEVAGDERAGAVAAPPPQERVEPRGELGEGERLDEVVVGAGLEPGDAVVDLVARGQDADRDVDAVGPHPADHADAVEVGHHHVEDDDGRRTRRDLLQRSAPARGRRHGEALEAQRALEGLPDGRLVVDDEDQRLRGEEPHAAQWCH